MSKYGGVVHVQNPTALPRWDEFNGIELIFQPDQTKNPGTFGVEKDETGRPILKGGKRNLIKLTDAKANNVTLAPAGWFDAHFKSPATRQVKGLSDLVIVEQKAEHLLKENERLKKEAADVQKQHAQIAELQNALAELEGVAPEGTDVGKGIASIKQRIASIMGGKAAKK